MTWFGNSATPKHLTGAAAAVGLATVGVTPYDAAVVGTFLVPDVAKEVSHSAAPAIPVIVVFRESLDFEIGYSARSTLADGAMRNLPKVVTGLIALNVVPPYPAQSYMTGFFDE